MTEDAPGELTASRKLGGSKDFKIPIASVSEASLAVSGVSIGLAVSYNFGYFWRVGFDNLMYFNLVDLIKSSFVLMPLTAVAFLASQVAFQFERFSLFHRRNLVPSATERLPRKVQSSGAVHRSAKRIGACLLLCVGVALLALRIGMPIVSMTLLLMAFTLIPLFLYLIDPDFPNGPAFYMALGIFAFAESTSAGFTWADKALHSTNIARVIQTTGEVKAGVLLRSGDKGILLYSVDREATTFFAWQNVRAVESTTASSLPIDRYVEQPDTNKFIKWFWAR